MSLPIDDTHLVSVCWPSTPSMPLLIGCWSFFGEVFAVTGGQTEREHGRYSPRCWRNRQWPDNVLGVDNPPSCSKSDVHDSCPWCMYERGLGQAALGRKHSAGSVEPESFPWSSSTAKTVFGWTLSVRNLRSEALNQKCSIGWCSAMDVRLDRFGQACSTSDVRTETFNI